MAIVAKIADGAEVLDLGAARNARAEARGDSQRFLKLAVGYVEVLPEVPLEAAMLFKSEDIRGGVAGMLVDPTDVDAIFKDGLTAEDLNAIALFIAGKSLGE